MFSLVSSSIENLESVKILLKLPIKKFTMIFIEVSKSMKG